MDKPILILFKDKDTIEAFRQCFRMDVYCPWEFEIENILALNKRTTPEIVITKYLYLQELSELIKSTIDARLLFIARHLIIEILPSNKSAEVFLTKETKSANKKHKVTWAINNFKKITQIKQVSIIETNPFKSIFIKREIPDLKILVVLRDYSFTRYIERNLNSKYNKVCMIGCRKWITAEEINNIFKPQIILCEQYFIDDVRKLVNEENSKQSVGLIPSCKEDAKLLDNANLIINGWVNFDL